MAIAISRNIVNHANSCNVFDHENPSIFPLRAYAITLRLSSSSVSRANFVTTGAIDPKLCT
jgi:hypothetical protein